MDDPKAEVPGVPTSRPSKRLDLDKMAAIKPASSKRQTRLVVQVVLHEGL